MGYEGYGFSINGSMRSHIVNIIRIASPQYKTKLTSLFNSKLL